MGERRIRRTRQCVAWLRRLSASAANRASRAGRADRNQHIRIQIDPLKTIRVQPAHDRWMVVSEQELGLRLEQQLFASREVGRHQLNGGTRAIGFRLAERPLRSKVMRKTSRRDIFAAVAGAAASGVMAESGSALAQAGPKPIFQVPATTIPIVGETDVFQVRRIYCIGRNYAAHAIERGFGRDISPA